MARNYEILLHSPDSTLVKFNPVAYRGSLVCFEETDPDAEIAFNANYFWKQAPIGMFEMRKWARVDRILGPQLRPVMEFCDVKVQAGPILVETPPSDWRDWAKVGDFKPDALRKTAHTAVGRTEAGKIIVGYFANHSLDQIAEAMAKHCVWVMKCDGGHSAFLRVGDVVRGERLYCGVQLKPRNKGGFMKTADEVVDEILECKTVYDDDYYGATSETDYSKAKAIIEADRAAIRAEYAGLVEAANKVLESEPDQDHCGGGWSGRIRRYFLTCQDRSALKAALDSLGEK